MNAQHRVLFFLRGYRCTSDTANGKLETADGLVS